MCCGLRPVPQPPRSPHGRPFRGNGMHVPFGETRSRSVPQSPAQRTAANGSRTSFLPGNSFAVTDHPVSKNHRRRISRQPWQATAGLSARAIFSVFMRRPVPPRSSPLLDRGNGSCPVNIRKFGPYNDESFPCKQYFIIGIRFNAIRPCVPANIAMKSLPPFCSGM